MRAYNDEGEPEYAVVDMDRDDVIDYNGTDRITQTVTDVLTNYSTTVRRSRTCVHTTDSSTTTLLTNTSEASADGLKTWNTAYGQTSTSVRTVPSSGAWTVTATAADGSKVITAYANARVASVTRQDSTSAQIGKMTYAYNAHGNLSTSTDARNGATTFTYDNADRVVTTTTPLPGNGQSAQTTTSYFNNRGNVWKMLYPDGTSITNEFYLTGLRKKTSGSRVYPVEYTYDAQGRLKTQKTWTDFVGSSGAATTTWNYHTTRGWLLNKRDPNNEGADYTRTSAGRLQVETLARGTPRITITHSYNNAGEVSAMDYSDSTPDVTYTYDRRGRQTVCVHNSITTTRYFNDAGLLIGEAYSGGVLSGLNLTNLFDSTLRRTQATTKNNTTTLTSATYTYDNASRLSTAGDGTYSVSYTYLANSPLVGTVTFKENTTTRMTTSRQFDYLNRLQSISSAPSASSALSFNYQYNDANQRVRVTSADGSYWLYDYDALGQVKSGKRYWSDNTPVVGQQNEYAFDDIGNRETAKSGGDSNGANLRSATYTSNSRNQYTQRTVPGAFDVLGIANLAATVTVNSQSTYRKGEYFHDELSVNNSSAAVWQSVSVQAVNGGASTTETGNVFVPETPEAYTYDKDGNTLTDGRWTLTWNAANRLTAQESFSGAPSGSKQKLEHEYDCGGRRIQKKVYTWNGSSYVLDTTLKFLYDGWNLVSVLDGSNTLLYSFRWGTDASGTMQGAGGVGGLISMTVHSGTYSGTYFYAYDGNHNVVALVNGSDGSVVAQYEYGPFHELIRASGPLALINPFRAATKYCDDESGFYYYGYRFYDPSTGRWLSRDPVAERGGVNLYGMVGNDAVSGIDVFGLFLAAIDGTDSSKSLRIDTTTGRFNSHVRNFYEDYTGPGAKRYWHGPNLSGGGVSETVEQVYKSICEALKTNPLEDINIVGHSRGGLIAVLAAKKLKKEPCACGSNRIRFMGLYDAVDRYLYANAETIPDNVEYVAHARRDPGVGSRSYFGNTGTSGGQTYVEEFFWVTHGGAGGDPWGGDHPTRTVVDLIRLGEVVTHEEPTITKEQDEAGSVAVDAWLRSHFH